MINCHSMANLSFTYTLLPDSPWDCWNSQVWQCACSASTLVRSVSDPVEETEHGGALAVTPAFHFSPLCG